MIYRFTLISCILLFAVVIKAGAQDARALVKEGITLSNEKNYTGAVEKFKAALAVEPDNASANYQLGFTLNAAGKGTEAIPYLQKVTATDSAGSVTGAAYALLGNIYDRGNQPQKAIENFTQAIKLTPGEHTLHYSLGLAYFRAKRYADAEQSAIKALAITPTHAASVRLYALVTFHQDKRAPALLALSHFLWLEPNGSKSAEAYGNIQSILSGGALKPEAGVKPANANHKQLNQAIINAANTSANKRYATPADKLAGELSAIFESIGSIAPKQTGNDSLFNALAARHYQLAKAGLVPAYTRFITQASDKSAAAWLKAHPQEVARLKE